MRVTRRCWVVVLVVAHVAHACRSRAIDSYVASNHRAPTGLDDADHLDTVHPGQYALNATTLAHLASSDNLHNVDNILDNPFWLACLDLVLDLRLPRPAIAHDVTLVTHTTLSRLHSTAAQCAAWPGSLVVAVYIPLLPDGAHVANNSTPLQAQLTQLAVRATAMHARGACALHMLVYAETLPVVADEKALEHVYQYPINALRNRALLAASTELVMLVDADMVPGPRWWLEEILRQPNDTYVEQLAARCRLQRSAAALLPFALHGDGQLLQVAWCHGECVCAYVPQR